MNAQTPEEIVREYHSKLASKGGKARAANLTAEERSAIAKRAAKVSARVRKRNARNKKAKSKKNSLQGC